MAGETQNLAEELFEEHEEALAQHAGLAVRKGHLLREFFILAVDLEDDTWALLLAHLARDLDPDEADEDDRFSVMITSVSVLKSIAHVVPKMADALMQDPPEGHIRLVVLCEGSIHVRPLKPRFDGKDDRTLC